jgi:hypothetical protein
LVILSLATVIVLLRGEYRFSPPHGDEIWENLTPSEGFNPWFGRDPFTTEVALSKSGMIYNLSEIMKIENVNICEESITYRSHYNPDVSVILTKTRFHYHGDSYSPYLLSVGLKIPSEPEGVPYPFVRVVIELTERIEEVNENFIRSLGYEGDFDWFFSEDREDFKSYWVKNNIRMDAAWVEENEFYYSDNEVEKKLVWFGEFGFFVKNENSLSPELEEEFKSILEAHGINRNVWENAKIEVLEGMSEISIPTVDIDPEAFDWGEAMRVELTWLRDIRAISGITDHDIESTSSLCKLRTSGYNGRVVFYNGEWMYYHETGLPLIE